MRRRRGHSRRIGILKTTIGAMEYLPLTTHQDCKGLFGAVKPTMRIGIIVISFHRTKQETRHVQ